MQRKHSCLYGLECAGWMVNHNTLRGCFGVDNKHAVGTRDAAVSGDEVWKTKIVDQCKVQRLY